MKLHGFTTRFAFWEKARRMGRLFCLSLVLPLLLLVALQASAAESTDNLSPSQQAKAVPTYVLTDGSQLTQTLYNPDSAQMLLDMSVAAYSIGDDNEWMNLFAELGYGQLQFVENNNHYVFGSTIFGEMQENVDVLFRAVNACIGIQPVTYNGQEKQALVIAFRGTNLLDLEDLITDASILTNDDGLHSGFAANAGDFHDLRSTIGFYIDGQYTTLEAMLVDMKNPNSKYCMLVTGHSLGAAIADIYVGHYLQQFGVHPSNVVAYTFATPKSAASYYPDYPYTNIFNILNTDDIVTYVGGSKQIGATLPFTPTDSFRRQVYGSQYEEGKDSDWYSGVKGSLDSGFIAHNLNGTYRAIVKEIAGQVPTYFPCNTVSDNVWGSVRIDPGCFRKISGDLTVRGDLIFEEGRLEVSGDCTLGDGVSGELSMTHDDDYLLVNGDFTISYYYSSLYSSLSAGTIELKGDFTETAGGYPYPESGTHKTVFSGSGTQTISFAHTNSDYCKFENLYLYNTDVCFATPIYRLTLACDTIVTNPCTIVSNELDTNGFSLNLAGSAKFTSVKIDGGTASISGDLTVQGDLIFEEGRLEVGGNCTLGDGVSGELSMTHDDDYLLVNGDLTISYYSGESFLSAGTVELKGDFTETSGGYPYHESDTHKTVFSGSGTQTISFAHTNSYYCKFENLYLYNTDICFATPIYQLILNQDTVLTNTDNLVVTDKLDLNGYSLQLPGSAEIGHLVLSNGQFSAAGDAQFDSALIDGGTASISGDLTVRGNLIFEEGRLEVSGDCTLGDGVSGELSMTHEDDYLLVNGDLTISYYSGESFLSAGTVELKGDFTETSGGYPYHESDTHKTVFSGSGTQTISFAHTNSDYCKFENLYLYNTDICFATPIYQLILNQDTVLTNTSNLVVTDKLDLNGHLLVQYGQLYAGQLTLSGGDLVQIDADGANIAVAVHKGSTQDIQILVASYTQAGSLNALNWFRASEKSAVFCARDVLLPSLNTKCMILSPQLQPLCKTYTFTHPDA